MKPFVGAGAVEAEPERPQPAVPIKRSVFPDYIVCLEDGKKLKMLKRHLQSAYGMSPEQYRERWGLPADYPWLRRLRGASLTPRARDRARSQINANLDVSGRKDRTLGNENEGGTGRSGRKRA